MTFLQALLELAVRFWPATLALALYAWRYVKGGKKGWTRRGTRRATHWTARHLFPERPVPRRALRADSYDRHGNYIGPKDRRRTYSAAQRARIIRRDGPQCQCTGCRGHDGRCRAVDGQPGVRLECDHRHPWAHGGRTNLANGQMLCGPCNRAKGARLPDTDEKEWAA